MKTEYIFLKEAPMPTNCPECYTITGLRLAFYQKRIVSKLFKSVTPVIEDQLNCKTCGTRIYPGRWTDAIERMYVYQKKKITPNKRRFELTTLSYLILGVFLLSSALGIYLYTV